MKHGVFTVILPKLNLAETIDEVAAAGYDGIEWRCREIPISRIGEPFSYWGNVKNDIPPANMIRDGKLIAEKCEAAGLECFALASYCSVLDEEDVQLSAEAAAAIGAPYFRVGPPGYKGDVNYHTLYNQAVEAYGKAIEIAKPYGVAVAVETHMGNITPSAGLMLWVVSSFEPDDIGVIYDPGNMVKEGCENYQMGLEVIGPYLKHVHVKNMSWGVAETLDDGTDRWEANHCPLSKGVVDWREVVKALRAVGYDGYLSLEDFSDTIWNEKLSGDLEYMQAIVAEVDAG